MGTPKRERRKEFRAEKIARKKELQRREVVANDIRRVVTDKDYVQRAVGSGILTLFAYNFATKAGIPLPSARDHLPEPLDLPDHVGNVYWTMALMKMNYSKIRKIPVLRTMNSQLYPYVKAVDYEKNGENGQIDLRYNTNTIAAATVSALAVHMAVEFISNTAGIAVLTGGADPLDVIYGAGAAGIASAWNVRKVNQAITAHPKEHAE